MMLVPLLAYIGVTVLAPAINGAARREGFWEHAVITLTLSGLMTCARLAVRPRQRRNDTVAAMAGAKGYSVEARSRPSESLIRSRPLARPPA